ncbi:MAG: DUF2807 domain-containing protein [Bacteroidales bacterium]|jgi:HSP20 family molecular chaperone IbpA|nr:DUF2807 domain-containing protein [Bacteroidales bacterium]
MKKLILSVVLCGLTFAAFCQKSEVRSVSGFTGIEASSVFHITVSKGNAESLTIETDEAVMPQVRCEVKNGVLHLFLANRHTFKNSKPVNASIVMKELNTVQLSGACHILIKDVFTSKSFKVECSGASNCEAVAGIKASTLDIDLSGSSHLKLKAEAENAKIEGSGAPNIDISVQAENLNLDFGGSANVKLVGKVDNLSIDSSGASKIDAVGLEANSVNVETSGASSINVFATERLKVESSGASSIGYKGSPSIEMDSSGASKIRQIK